MSRFIDINEKEIIEIAKQVISDMTYDDITSRIGVGICSTFQDLLYGKIPLKSFGKIVGIQFEFSEEWLNNNYELYSGNSYYPVPSTHNKLSAEGCFYEPYRNLPVLNDSEREEYKQNRLKLLEAMKKNPDFKIDVFEIIHIIL